MAWELPEFLQDLEFFITFVYMAGVLIAVLFIYTIITYFMVNWWPELGETFSNQRDQLRGANPMILKLFAGFFLIVWIGTGITWVIFPILDNISLTVEAAAYLMGDVLPALSVWVALYCITYPFSALLFGEPGPIGYLKRNKRT